MVARRRGDRIPGDLGIEVRVDVHEARGDRLAGGIDLLRVVLPSTLPTATIRSPLTPISARTRPGASPVDDGAVSDDEVVTHLQFSYAEDCG